MAPPSPLPYPPRSPPSRATLAGLLVALVFGAGSVAAVALAPGWPIPAWLLLGLGSGLVSGAGALLWWRMRSALLDREREREEAARALLAGRLERMNRNTTDLVFFSDESLRIVEVSGRAAQALGYAREELVGMLSREVRDPATVGDWDARIREEIENGVAMFQTRYRRKDGSTFPVEVTVHSDVQQGRRWFQAVARDISGRLAAEDAVRQSEEKFRAVFEQSVVGMTLTDRSGRIVSTNHAFRELLGYSEEAAASLSITDLREVSGGPPPVEVFGRLRDGQADVVEIPRTYLRPDGGRVEVVLRAKAVRDGAGALRFVLGAFEDLTERKRIEAQLLLADRMVSVGTLAAGIAHEVNNPLSFVLSNLDFALRELAASQGVDREVLRALEDAKVGGGRVRAIVRDLKSFSRGGDEARAPLDLRSVLLSAVGLASNEIRHRAQVSVDPGDVPLVLGSERRLAQVLLNLLINAAQAIPEGNAQANGIRASTGTAPDGRAFVEISDTGCGIPPELRSRIFDPFFTTKPVGEGTGLGLSICHAIVTQHGGEVSVEDAPGGGSTFRVLLPAAARAREPFDELRDAAEASPGTGGRRGRVLVVDDEAPIGRAIQRVLSPHHDVTARTSARESLDDLLAGTAYDVVLCDLMMPDMTGMELHARLAEAGSPLAARMVFLTGGAFTPAAREFLERVPNARMDKPFDPAALREAVALAMEAAPGPAGEPASPGRER